MAERTEPIRQDIEATRASMSDKMEQIEGQVREKVDTTVQQARQALDLRHQVQERPWLALGAALTMGFVVGSMGDGHRTHHGPHYPQPGQPMRYYSQQGHLSAEDRSSNPQNYNAYSGNRGDYESHGHSSGTLSQIAGPMREELSVMAVAAVRSAMRVLRESLQDSIPQFEKEYRAVQHEREEDTPGAARHPSDYPEQRANAVGATTATTTTDRANESAFRARQG